jgi:hypothetical protein
VPVQGLSLHEKDQYKVNDRLNQLMQGRSNATGTVTLSATGATATTVSAPTCQVGSHVFLTPHSYNAAAMTIDPYVLSTNVSKQQFTVTHTCSTSTDLTFGWHVIG